MEEAVRTHRLASDWTLASNVFDCALAFEGGGYRAAYTAGIVVVLLEREIYFDYVCGISAGASHTLNYLSRDIPRAVLAFLGVDGTERLGGLGSFVRGKGYFNADYMYEGCLFDGFFPFDWRTFAANPARMRLQAFERDTGRTATFGREDAHDTRSLFQLARASATIPIAMNPSPIDGVTYFDGGLGEGAGIPLRMAERDGFERTVLVATRPAGYRKKPLSPRARKVMGRLLGRHPHLLEAVLTRNERYNAELDRVARLEREGSVLVIRPDEMPVSNGTLDSRKLEAAYQQGYDQALRELPRLRDFVGL